MKHISFEAIGEQMVTFLAADGAASGEVGKITVNQTVDVCSDGDKFCGVIGTVRGGTAALQMGGYAELAYTGTAPTLGWCGLAADGNGGVKIAATGGREYLVVSVDSENKIVGLFL